MSTTALAPRRTILDAALPRQALPVQLALVVAASLCVAASAWLSIRLPFTPVPITGQTYAFLLVGALLGSRRGALAMVMYLGEGLVGLPVFHGGANAWTPSGAGVPTIIGPTAGYLLACPVVAFVVGWLAERGWDRRMGRAVVMMVVGEVVIYLGGLSWLAHYVGPAMAVQLGLAPFMAGDAAKLLLAAATLPLGWTVVHRARG